MRSATDRQITIQLVDQKITGIASDLRAMGLLSMLLPEYHEIVRKEKGLQEAFNRFSETFDKTKNDSDKAYEEWGERLLIRLMSDPGTRANFCQLIVQTFPNIHPHWVSYVRWFDENNRPHDNGGTLGLDTEDLMSIITPVIEIGMKTMREKAQTAIPAEAESYPQSEAQPPKAKGFAPASSEDRVAQLEAELAAARQETAQ